VWNACIDHEIKQCKTIIRFWNRATGVTRVATTYGHKSYNIQFQTRSLLFFHSRQASIDDRLSQPLSHNSLNSTTTRSCRAHVQSAIGRRVSTNCCRWCCGWISALGVECSTLPPLQGGRHSGRQLRVSPLYFFLKNLATFFSRQFCGVTSLFSTQKLPTFFCSSLSLSLSLFITFTRVSRYQQCTVRYLLVIYSSVKWACMMHL